ncbi:hypothetical protein C812_04313 [Paenibacillus barengoltzii G22]|uniref:Uncharacterized protein n=1 Tax=Paenibacillus barengoltzii G22 TaxID=1235795 RepID=R9L4M6_9BACL|nr:hypothetical protein C812_04313 [Paenibacillus barengoltzii G22]
MGDLYTHETFTFVKSGVIDISESFTYNFTI